MNYSTLLTAGAALLTAACASTQLVVPDAIQPATNESLATTVGARGVQVYECRVRKDGGGHEWAFVAPDADLLDAHGKAIGHHGAGPYWQAADGSRVVGTVKARADAPATGAIPWLLLTTKSSGSAGEFSNITSIQRVNTVGGIAPATPCTAQLTGTPVRVPYTADYRLFIAR
jgi:Protein of unknown function (DUF3455)